MFSAKLRLPVYQCYPQYLLQWKDIEHITVREFFYMSSAHEPNLLYADNEEYPSIF